MNAVGEEIYATQLTKAGMGMPKRFTDTEKWQDEWFANLEPAHKLLWLYICDNCDHAGIWKVAPSVASALIGQKVDLDAALEAFGDRIAGGQGYWIVTRFVKFQYGLPLNPGNRTHASVLRLLKDRDIDTSSYEGPSTDHPSPSVGVKDKDKDSLKQDFDLFYKAYPKKKKPDDAWKAWQQMAPPIQDVLAALKWQVKQEGWLSDQGKWVPYPASYLRAGSWKEEPPYVKQAPPRLDTALALAEASRRIKETMEKAQQHCDHFWRVFDPKAARLLGVDEQTIKEMTGQATCDHCGLTMEGTA